MTWKKNLSEFPADSWTLVYEFVTDGAHFQITATNLADGFHTVEEATTTTANYTPGMYKWQSFVNQGPDRFPIASGTMEVKADFATQLTGLDARSDIETIFDALTAALKGKASKDQLSYTIQGRSISRFTPTELLQWHDKYRRLLAQERAVEKLQKGRDPGNKVLVRFREFI